MGRLRAVWVAPLLFSSIMATCVLVDGRRLDAAEPSSVRRSIVVSPEAIAIHRSAPVVDGHNDLPWALRKAGASFERLDLSKPQPQFHTDVVRLKKGGVGAQFWSVYVPSSTFRQGSALTTTLEQIALVKEMTQTHSDVFELALNTADVQRIRREGRIASMIGVEGGHSIENSIGALRQLYREGARYMTLTHSMSLPWADSCSDESISGGLSAFGQEVVREMNRLGMMVDLSHVSPDCMRQALRVTSAPVIFSHSSVRSVADHVRNVPDDVIELTKANGGVVMINFFPDFVHPVDAERSRRRSAMRVELASRFPDDPERAQSELQRWEKSNPRSSLCTANDVVDHIDRVVRLAGVDHVGLGSDFDGVPALPRQLEDVSTYPVITQGMLDRGYSQSEIRKVLGENVMRVFRQVEQAAEEEGR